MEDKVRERLSAKATGQEAILQQGFRHDGATCDGRRSTKRVAPNTDFEVAARTISASSSAILAWISDMMNVEGSEATSTPRYQKEWPCFREVREMV